MDMSRARISIEKPPSEKAQDALLPPASSCVTARSKGSRAAVPSGLAGPMATMGLWLLGVGTLLGSVEEKIKKKHMFLWGVLGLKQAPLVSLRRWPWYKG